MVCLYKKSLSSTISVDGEDYPIQTDFRFWIAFLIKVQKNELSMLDVVTMFPYQKPDNLEKSLISLLDFANTKNILPRDIGKNNNVKIFDYDLDADLIFSAFLEVYHIDLLDEKTKLHYHKFCALFNGLHNTKLNDIMRIRSYDENDKTTYEQSQKQLKESWEIREEIKLTEYEQKLLDDFENALK